MTSNLMSKRLEGLTPEQRALLALKAKQKKQESAEPMLRTLSREEGGTSFPLSFTQRRLWFIEQLEKGSARYNFCNAYRIKGKLDAAALERAVQAIAERHEIWRTTFAEVDGEPVQVTVPALEIRLERVDCRGQSAEELHRAILDRAEAPFDLANGPLVKPALLQTAADAFVFVLTTHHMVNDGWSVGVMVSELQALYGHFALGEPLQLPALPVQFADYAVWQREWMQGEAPKRQLAYWKDKLAGELPVLELPTDRVRQPIKTQHADSVYSDIPAAKLEPLKELSRKLGGTPFMAVLAALKLQLHRYTGLDDILIGSPIAGRRRKELEGLIGFFANTLVFRTKLSGEMDFAGLLEQVKETTLAAYDHPDIQFETLVEELKVKRDLSNTPIFQLMFSYESGEEPVPALGDLTVGVYEIEGRTGSYDLAIYMTEGPSGLRVKALYNTDLFDAASVKRFLDRFELLLERLPGCADLPIARVPLLLPEEERKLLAEWAPPFEAPAGRICAHERFERQAALTPDAIAVTFEGQSCTYRELNEQANRLAHHLLSLGIGRERKVAVFVDRSVELLTAILGVLKAGGAYIPIDPLYPHSRIRHMLESADAQLMLTQEKLKGKLPDLGAIQVISMDGQPSPFAGASNANPDAGVAAGDLMYVLFTSGSTGKPKGVAVEHGHLASFLDAAMGTYRIPDGSSFAVVTTWAADLGLTMVWYPLCTGGRLHIVSYERATDPDAFAAYFREHRIDVLKLVPSHFEALQAAANPADVLPQRMIVFSGEPCYWDTVAKVRRLRPELQIRIGYGPTETTVTATDYPVGALPARAAHGMLPLGRPMGGYRAYVLDALRQPTPIGVPGELYVGGPSVTRGYAGRPDLTAERFVAHPFDPAGGRLYRTGDLVKYRPDGVLEFLGRIDHQVKIRGYRVELGEIEAVLQQHEALRDAVVVAWSDPAGDKRLIAYVVPQPGGEPSAAALRAALKEQLPDYMIPAAFVALEAIPLNANGKVDRALLPEPDLSKRESGGEYAAPRDEQETELARIWAELLGRAQEEIGIHDNFFDLGGDSFKAIKVIRALGNAVGVMDLFQHPTIGELAALLSGGRGDSDDVLHRFTLPASGTDPVITLVCVPYGGGSAITYQPLARTLPAGYALYALEIPGHDISRPELPLESVETVARRCVEEIKRKIKGPIAVYGQCLGGSLALRIAYLLEEEGLPLKGVFMGGIFPSPRLPGKFFELWAKWFPTDRWVSDRAYRETLQAFGGVAEDVDPQEVKFMLRAMRHDSRQAEDYFTEVCNAEQTPKLSVPIACVVGERDRMTEFYQERYLEWEQFSDRVELAAIPGAGHYFQKHQVAELTDIIRQQVESWQADEQAEAAALQAVYTAQAAQHAYGATGAAIAQGEQGMPGTAAAQVTEAAQDEQAAQSAQSAQSGQHTQSGQSASGQAIRQAVRETAVGKVAAPQREQRMKPSMRTFLAITAGQIISVVGSTLSAFALGVWVYENTGSVSAFALISLFAMLPSIVLLPLAGALADRISRRAIMAVTDIVPIVANLIVLALLARGDLLLWQIYAFVTIGSVCNAFRRPAYMAAITQIAPKKYLMQANSISQLSNGFGGVIAPLLGGVFYVALGLTGVLIIDTITFAAATLILLTIPFPRALYRRLEEPILKEIVGGWKYIMKRKSLVAMVVFFIVVNYLESTFEVLQTPLLLAFTTPEVLGVATSFTGFGILVGSLMMSVTGGLRRRTDGMVGLVFLSGLAITLCGLQPSVALIAGSLFLFGLSLAFVDTHWQALIQTKVGLELQGRVFATNQMMAWSMRPLSFLLAGPLVEHVFEPMMAEGQGVSAMLGRAIGVGEGRGTGLLIMLLGLALMLVTVWGMKYKPLRDMDVLLPDAVPDPTLLKDKDKLQELADRRITA